MRTLRSHHNPYNCFLILILFLKQMLQTALGGYENRPICPHNNGAEVKFALTATDRWCIHRHIHTHPQIPAQITVLWYSPHLHARTRTHTNIHTHIVLLLWPHGLKPHMVPAQPRY